MIMMRALLLLSLLVGYQTEDLNVEDDDERTQNINEDPFAKYNLMFIGKTMEEAKKILENKLFKRPAQEFDEEWMDTGKSLLSQSKFHYNHHPTKLLVSAELSGLCRLQSYGCASDEDQWNTPIGHHGFQIRQDEC